MNTEALILAQWLSPAYPVGAFAYSHGLEAAIQGGQIHDAAGLEVWLHAVLLHGSGRNDAILFHVAHGCDSAGALDHVNATGLAFAACAERVLETRAQGTAFCKITSEIWGGRIAGAPSDLIYPVAVGAAAGHLKLDPQLGAGMLIHAMLGNLVSASQRLMGLGQSRAQQIVARLAPDCAALGRETAGDGLGDLRSSCFASDIAAMRHEVQQPRIFRT